MLILISPAKTMDYVTPTVIKRHTKPAYLDDASELIAELRKFNSENLASLMNMSPGLAQLNVKRFHDWSPPFTTDNAKQALLAFKGDVYEGIDVASMDRSDLAFAQKHLRILSGLYGILRPLDLMQPYRLEMRTRMANKRGSDLYSFWGEKITQAVNKEQRHNIVINLASNEYFKALRRSNVKARIITPVFKDKKDGQYRVIGFFAKKARGLMVRYIVKNRLEGPVQLLEFKEAGYKFSKTLSGPNEWIFTRSRSQ